jgi:general secretion pathway protein H
MGCGGFTLLELLVVLVLIGLAAGLAAPRWLAALPGVQLTTAARKTAALLRYAGNRAVSEQALYQAMVDLEHKTVALSRLDTGGVLLPPGPTAPAQDHPPPEVLQIPAEISIAQAADGLGERQVERLKIFFFPGGGNSGGSLTLSNTRGRQLFIQVDFITGAVRIKEPEDA